MADEIFISYRRRDNPGIAGRIRDRLAERFGAQSVFMDVENLYPGQRFPDRLNEAANACHAMLAVIGPDWMGTDEHGEPRIKKDDDFVRLEVAIALRRRITTIPVLLENTPIPTGWELPVDLQDLTSYQLQRVRHEDFETDVRKLIDALLQVDEIRALSPQKVDDNILIKELRAERNLSRVRQIKDDNELCTRLNDFLNQLNDDGLAQGDLAQEADELLAQVEDRIGVREWPGVKQRRRIDEINDLMHRVPRWSGTAEAREFLRKLEKFDEEWASRKATITLNDVSVLLQTPGNLSASAEEEARARKTELERIAAIRREYDEARSKNDRAAVEAVLKKYPNAEFLSEAQQLLAHWSAAADTYESEKIADSSSVDQISQFLKRFPDGPHAVLARKRLGRLRLPQNGLAAIATIAAICLVLVGGYFGLSALFGAISGRWLAALALVGAGVVVAAVSSASKHEALGTLWCLFLVCNAGYLVIFSESCAPWVPDFTSPYTPGEYRPLPDGSFRSLGKSLMQWLTGPARYSCQFFQH